MWRLSGEAGWERGRDGVFGGREGLKWFDLV
jgi:hypothetical protein